MSKDGEAWERLQAGSRDPNRWDWRRLLFETKHPESFGPNSSRLLIENEDEQIINWESIRNDLFLAPRDLSVLLQPADIVSKFRKQLKNVRSHKDFLLGWSIHCRFDQIINTINLIKWSIHWQFGRMINTFAIWSQDQYAGNLIECSIHWKFYQMIDSTKLTWYRSSCDFPWDEIYWCVIWICLM